MNSQGDQRVACRVGPVRYMRLALVALVCRELREAQSHESRQPGSQLQAPHSHCLVSLGTD